jgi:hypothetical protein
VLYAVKGGKSDPSAGAVVDLKALREAGEEIRNVPLTDPEMKRLVHSTYEDLAERPAPPGAPPSKF